MTPGDAGFAQAPSAGEGPGDTIPVLGMSDPLTTPSGFGKVARVIFTSLPQDRFRLGYLSWGWVGTGKYPGVTCYSSKDMFNAAALPATAADFAGDEPYVLWTLMDLPQTGWISHWENNSLGNPVSRRYFAMNRDKVRWVGYFPVDSLGPRDGPPLWFEAFVSRMDVPVAMSKFAQETMKKVGLDVEYVPHGVDTSVYHPGDSGERLEKLNLATLTRALVIKARLEGRELTDESLAAEVQRKRFKLGDGPNVSCVMANRERKYWPVVLKAFAHLAETHRGARLVAVCGDRRGDYDPTAWPLEVYCQMLGLRVDGVDDDPNVWLVENLGRTAEEGEPMIADVHRAVDFSVLVSGGEGSGLPQLEAHACGVPVIVGRYSASNELILHSKEGVEPRGWYLQYSNMVKRPTYHEDDVYRRMRFAWENLAWRLEVGAAGVEQGRSLEWDNVMPTWVELLTRAHRGAKESFTSGAKPDTIDTPKEEEVPAVLAVENEKEVGVM